MAQYYNAIGFDREGKPYKYRNIMASKIPAFETFCITDIKARPGKWKEKPPLMYVNYYDANTRSFHHRQTLINE